MKQNKGSTLIRVSLRHYPTLRKELIHCPFLKKVGPKKYECTIYETRPEQCRDWDCILCWNTKSFAQGEIVEVGSRSYKVSNLKICPECQKKRGICRSHDFVSVDWLKRYIKRNCWPLG